MDGFYVAKFKVEKRAKVKAAAQDAEPADVKDVGEQQEDIGFDSEEDRAFIEGLFHPSITWNLLLMLFFSEGKRRQLKAKGLRVPRRRPSDVATKVVKTAA